jgi:hypothetical protein
MEIPSLELSMYEQIANSTQGHADVIAHAGETYETGQVKSGNVLVDITFQEQEGVDKFYGEEVRYLDSKVTIV